MIKRYLKPKIVAVTLFTILVAIAMVQLNINAERTRKAESDYSEGWFVDDAVVDVDSLNTTDYDGTFKIIKELPKRIRYDDALCFISANGYFDVCVGGRLIYSYMMPQNLTGRGYGTAYHAVNLSPDMAGKTVSITVRGAFNEGRGGRIRMMSLESPRSYFDRLASGQILSFVISCGIATTGILVLLFRVVLGKRSYELDTLSLAITGIIAGTWMAVDTGFLRLTLNAISFSRDVGYMCMHLCFLPVMVFVYSVTKERRRSYLVAAYIMTAVYLTAVFVARFDFDMDMAQSQMLRMFFIYILLVLILLVVMIVSDRRFCRMRSIKRDMSFFYIGIVTSVLCVAADCTVYLTGTRSVSGYATFSRIGCYVFFMSMGVEILRSWSHEYATLTRYGFVDELTGTGNRRSYLRFEERHRGMYPYGFVICDINALKKTNDTAGHDKGDELIRGVSQRLIGVFGEGNVFRVGGDEFVAYSHVPTEEEFEALIEKAREMFSGEDITASIGGAYAADPASDEHAIKKRAEEIMYAEKEKYYSDGHDRRR